MFRMMSEIGQTRLEGAADVCGLDLVEFLEFKSTKIITDQICLSTNVLSCNGNIVKHTKKS